MPREPPMYPDHSLIHDHAVAGTKQMLNVLALYLPPNLLQHVQKDVYRTHYLTLESYANMAPRQPINTAPSIN